MKSSGPIIEPCQHRIVCQNKCCKCRWLWFFVVFQRGNFVSKPRSCSQNHREQVGKLKYHAKEQAKAFERSVSNVPLIPLSKY